MPDIVIGSISSTMDVALQTLAIMEGEKAAGREMQVLKDKLAIFGERVLAR